jgi:hypothetical protein
MPSPGVSDEGAQMLAQRRAAVPVVDGKRACHTEHTPDAGRARDLQEQLPQH